jgi:DNA-binding protein H-NS
MARTLAEIQKQIDKLQALAERVKDKDKAGVVERIREAVEYYGISAEEVFGSGASAKTGKTRRASVGTKVGRKAGAKAGAKPKNKSPIRYRDDKGNSWTGHGQRPRWFKEAIASGITREELAAKA